MSAGFERFDETPSRLGIVVAFVPAAIAVVVAATTPLALAASALGAAVVLAGVRTGSRDVVTVGTIALFGGALLAGVQGASILQVTVGAAAAVVAWDAGTNAIGVARQLGARADAASVLIVHTLATAVVAILIGVFALGVFWVSRGGEPTTAVAMLLLAAVLFIVLLDR